MTKLTTDQEKIQIENMRKKVITLLEKFAKDIYCKFDSGYLEVEYHFDYGEIDYIQDHVRKLIKEGVTDREELRFTILEQLYDNELYGDNMLTVIQEQFLHEYRKELKKITDDWVLIDDEYLFFDLDIDVYFSYDIDDIINDTKLDILVLLENENAFDQEFGNNNFMDMHMYAKTKEDYTEYLEDSSINLLLESQGYTLDQLIDYMYYDLDDFSEELNRLRSDEVFISIVAELENAQNYQSLVLLTQMNVAEYLIVKELDNYLISKNSVIGYVGLVDGSGSILEVKLKNDIALGKDEFKIKLDGSFGYSVKDIYGLDFSYL